MQKDDFPPRLAALANTLCFRCGGGNEHENEWFALVRMDHKNSIAFKLINTLGNKMCSNRPMDK